MLIRYSMIDAFVSCPMKFYRNYILNEAEPVKSSALEYGSAMHLALEGFHEGDDPYSIFEMYWNAIKETNLEYDRFSWQELNDMTKESFLPNYIRLHSKKIKDAKMEETIVYPLSEEHTIQGTIDISCKYDGLLSIGDFKTSAREYSNYKIIRNPQLWLYAWLYQQQYGELPQQLFYKVFIKSERRIQTQKILLTQEKLDLQMKNVSAIVDSIAYMMATGKFYANYNCYCGTPQVCFPN